MTADQTSYGIRGLPTVNRPFQLALSEMGNLGISAWLALLLRSTLSLIERFLALVSLASSEFFTSALAKFSFQRKLNFVLYSGECTVKWRNALSLRSNASS